MSKRKIFQITSVIITLLGVGYTGYADGKGLENNYGSLVIGFGIALSIFTLLFVKEKEKT